MLPNVTDKKPQTAVKPYKEVAFEAFISWKALGGLVVDDEWTDPGSGKVTTNKIRQLTLEDFCNAYRIDRVTVWRWKNQTPDLAERITERRKELMPLSRVSAAYNQLFLLGMQSQDKRAAVEALKTFPGMFGELETPLQRQQITAGGALADLLQAARTNPESAQPEIIEGEVIRANPDPAK